MSSRPPTEPALTGRHGELFQWKPMEGSAKYKKEASELSNTPSAMETHSHRESLDSLDDMGQAGGQPIYTVIYISTSQLPLV